MNGAGPNFTNIKTKQDAKALAETLVKASPGDPIWVNLARELVVGCIRMLQVEKPLEWSANDLTALFSQDKNTIIGIMAKYHPEGLSAANTADATFAGGMSHAM